MLLGMQPVIYSGDSVAFKSAITLDNIKVRRYEDVPNRSVASCSCLLAQCCSVCAAAAAVLRCSRTV